MHTIYKYIVSKFRYETFSVSIDFVEIVIIEICNILWRTNGKKSDINKAPFALWVVTKSAVEIQVCILGKSKILISSTAF